MQIWELFIVNRHIVTLLVTVFSNLTKFIIPNSSSLPQDECNDLWFKHLYNMAPLRFFWEFLLKVKQLVLITLSIILRWVVAALQGPKTCPTPQALEFYPQIFYCPYLTFYCLSATLIMLQKFCCLIFDRSNFVFSMHV